MKVGELIDRLRAMPDHDAEVSILFADGLFGTIEKVTTLNSDKEVVIWEYVPPWRRKTGPPS